MKWLKITFFVIILISLFIISFVKSDEVTGEVITGEASSQSTNVSVNVVNSAPVLGEINSTIYTCEGNFLTYPFNMTDINANALTLSISPQDPFFISPTSFSSGQTTRNANIISGVLTKSNSGGLNNGSKSYNETISVNDGTDSDSANTTIVVIEINNGPKFTNTIGTKTIQNQGDNATLYVIVNISDTEDGNRTDGIIDFNVSIKNSTGSSVSLFNISSVGVINFTATSSTTADVYNVSVCINDTGIDNPHTNISTFCNQGGGTIVNCTSFSLTVTGDNRAPSITSFSPTNLTFSVSGDTSTLFSVTKSDPDGTIPDGYWYVDGVFKDLDRGNLQDSFSYTFGCGVSGVHNVKAEITDGLLNASKQWNITVSEVLCPVTSSAGGGSVTSSGGTSTPVKDFTIDKERIEVILKQGKSKLEEITIKNNEATEMTFEISNVGLQDFVILSEQNFILAPGESKRILIDITAQENTPPDLYFGRLVVNGDGDVREVFISVEVETPEVLFDVRVQILEESLPILPGRDLFVNVIVYSLTKVENSLDIVLEYIIMDERGREILLETEEVSLKDQLSLNKRFTIPKDIKQGRYVFYVRALYKDEVGSSTVWFSYSEEEKRLFELKQLIIILVLAILTVLLAIILVKLKKKRSYL